TTRHALGGPQGPSPALQNRSLKAARLRTHSWAYDTQGRAVESSLHHPPRHAYALRIAYRRTASDTQPGLTVVANANGSQTRFEFARLAGRYALLKVDGAACPGCAAPGTRAAYDQHGRLRQINGARILRGPSGELLHLVPQAPGWPGLHFGFDGQGRRKTWGADATGTEETLFDAQGRAVRRRFSDGGEWHYL